MRAPDRVRRRLAEPDMANLALRDELGHRADGLLDRDVRVDAVLVVEVDVVGVELPERDLDRALDVLSGSIEGTQRRHVPRGRVVHPTGELGRDHDVVAAPLDRPADELLVGQRAVQLRRVKEVDPEFEGAVDRLHRLVVIGRAVERGHPHAPEPDGGHLKRSQLALLHCTPIVRGRNVNVSPRYDAPNSRLERVPQVRCRA